MGGPSYLSCHQRPVDPRFGDQRFDLVIEVSTGDESDITQIAEQLRAWSYK
jgi:hypothetical protein